MKTQHPLIGAHISIAGNIALSIERAKSIGSSTMQIFTKSNRSWFDKPLHSDDITAFKQAMLSAELRQTMVHASYLINIAASSESVEKNSIKSLALELERAESLSIPYLVLHPGSHTGAGVEAGLKKIAANLDLVLSNASGKTMILIETMAGQGSNLGSTFEEVKQIFDQTKHQALIGVCFDTCHVFSAGYNFSSDNGYAEVFEKFELIVGLKHLKAFHLNDSKTPFNSHKDRHEELGKGSIPLAFFKKLMNDKRFSLIPKILETPTDPAMQLYRNEIILLKSMID